MSFGFFFFLSLFIVGEQHVEKTFPCHDNRRDFGDFEKDWPKIMINRISYENEGLNEILS